MRDRQGVPVFPDPYRAPFCLLFLLSGTQGGRDCRYIHTNVRESGRAPPSPSLSLRVPTRERVATRASYVHTLDQNLHHVFSLCGYFNLASIPNTVFLSWTLISWTLRGIRLHVSRIESFSLQI